MSKCIFCGTEIEEDYCYECAETASDLGLDYEDMVNSI